MIYHELNSERAISALRKIQKNDDKEEAHIDADEVLCKLLLTLGYKEVVKEYEKIDKWYA